MLVRERPVRRFNALLPMTYVQHAASAVCLAASLVCASPATAQYYGQSSDLPIGEDYHVEILAGMWKPVPDITIASDAFGITGTDINFANDLGIETQRFGELRLRLRPGRKHRFRIDYIPIRYLATKAVKRRLIFRGIAFEPGVPVTSQITWHAWRIGYEYDIVHRPRGYFGIIVEAKYTDVEAVLDTSFGSEFVRAQAPIPAIGAVLRIYPFPALGITAEATAFQLPKSFNENYRTEYVDFDLYGTLNFVQKFGIQIGYRSLDLRYLIDGDAGALKLNGAYVAALLRF